MTLDQLPERLEDGVTAPLWLRQSNLYFVPVLRQRLEFAVLFRRAIHQLQEESEWDPKQDLIAVALPPSVRQIVLQAIEQLPAPRLVLAETAAGVREVFPVTPCDALIEAIRLASENEWPLEFVDLEIAPGNLLRGPCARDNAWPDDSLVHELGPERYMALVGGYFSSPPGRIEPLDTWRESHIANQLRCLQPRWRRILVVCEMGLTPAAKELIQHPTTENNAPAFDAQRLRYSLVDQLRLDALLTYLDDFPYLVAKYEDARYDDAHVFDKLETLMDEIRSFAHDCKDLKLSTRQHQTFNALLQNVLALRHRRSPTLDVLCDVASACFGPSLAERLLCHLAGYRDLIKVDRVAANSTARPGLVRVQLDIESANHGFVGRSCNPAPRSLRVTPAPPREGGAENSEATQYEWLPKQHFERDMYRKLEHVSAKQSRIQRSKQYSGSIELGIDVRRTIRATFSGRPVLYVKSFGPARDTADSPHEPTVWLFRDQRDAVGNFGSSPIGINTDPVAGKRNSTSFKIGSMSVSEDMDDDLESHVLYRSESEESCVAFSDLLAWITFAYDFDTSEDAERELGAELGTMCPDHGEFEHPEIGCVHRDFAALERDGAGWLELSLLLAVKQARQYVTVVSPPGLLLPTSVMAYAASQKKAFRFVSLGHFSREERRKLGVDYHYIAKGATSAAAQRAFVTIMRQYW